LCYNFYLEIFLTKVSKCFRFGCPSSPIYTGNLIDLIAYDSKNERQLQSSYVNIDYFRNHANKIVFRHEPNANDVYSQPTRNIILQTLMELNDKSDVSYSEPIRVFNDRYIIVDDTRLISRIRTICFFHEHLQNHLFYLNIKKIDEAQLNILDLRNKWLKFEILTFKNS